MINYDVIEDTLRVLSKKSMDRAELARYLGNKHSRDQVKTALIRLKRMGYVASVGPHKHFTYSITEKGKEILGTIDYEALKKNIEFEISKYVRECVKGGYDV